MLFVNGVVLSKGIAKISLLDLFDFSAQSYTFIFSLSHKFKRNITFADFKVFT